MTEGILSAGAEWGLRPAGENVVTHWLAGKST
jgi:hypothetical protein